MIVEDPEVAKDKVEDSPEDKESAEDEEVIKVDMIWKEDLITIDKQINLNEIKISYPILIYHSSYQVFSFLSHNN